MAFAATTAAVVIALSGHVVRIEADTSPGLPGLHLIGLPASTVTQTRDRVQAALLNSCWTRPDQRITVNVLPADMPKYGSALDLAIAVAILAATGAIPAEPLTGIAFLGELGLDGSIRHVRGLPCAIRTLITSGIRIIAVPATSSDETRPCAIIPAHSLTHLIGLLTSNQLAATPTADHAPEQDLADLPGNEAARHALEVSAAGGHHLLLHGTGPAAALAERLPGILPPLDDTTHATVTQLYALTGVSRHDRRRPLCAPHYTNTAAAIFGSRPLNAVRPGAVSLAHAGVLFLDDAPEYPRSILDGLRTPLDTGEIMLSGAGGLARLPARFQLVLATHPCPCAATPCRCGPAVRHRYLHRLTELREHIAITTPIHPLDWTAEKGETTATVAARVAEARARAAYRLTGTPHQANADLPALELRTTHRLDPDALDPLNTPLHSGTITPAVMTQILRLAWTLADLRAAARPTKDDTTAALRLWQSR